MGECARPLRHTLRAGWAKPGVSAPSGKLRLLILITIIEVLLTRTAASFATNSVTDRCDRSCLADVLQKYLDGLTARDPARAGMSSAVRATENGQVVQPGAPI